MRLLMLNSLATKHLSGSIPYATIAKALDVPEESVEIWVINGKLIFHCYILLTHDLTSSYSHWVD
jgi:hypothetical protein